MKAIAIIELDVDNLDNCSIEYEAFRNVSTNGDTKDIDFGIVDLKPLPEKCKHTENETIEDLMRKEGWNQYRECLILEDKE